MTCPILYHLWEEEGEEEANCGRHDGTNGSRTTKEWKDHKDKNYGAIAIHNTLELIG